MNKKELYEKALSNIHRYSLLNEIFAIRDERFPKEQQENMLCVNGYIGIDTLNRYVRYIDELIEYQNIGTLKDLNNLQSKIDKAIEYIEKHLEEHIIEDQPDEQSIFYDEKGYYIPNAKEQLLDILKGSK